ncbi:cytidine deaminase-like protein, partial [Lineolata rhizophorae]
PKTPQDYMRLALALARKSPPKPTNFRVGAVLVDESANAVLATGYTLELPGNTHAEQCCLAKHAAAHGVAEERVSEALARGGDGDAVIAIYTTMEPCAVRLSGNVPCVDRIVRTRGEDRKGGIAKVYSGVEEPEKFVGENKGRARLEACGIECVHLPGFEEEILEVATAGHEK